jgi:DNA-binding HxlR family transcriptional regulator
VAGAIQAIGGKWKMLVLRSLLLNGPQRYNDLLATVPGIQAKELTRNLRELQGDGLLDQSAATDRRATVYKLTETGGLLLPAFEGLRPVGERLAAVRRR